MSNWPTRGALLVLDEWGHNTESDVCVKCWAEAFDPLGAVPQSTRYRDIVKRHNARAEQEALRRRLPPAPQEQGET